MNATKKCELEGNDEERTPEVKRNVVVSRGGGGGGSGGMTRGVCRCRCGGRFDSLSPRRMLVCHGGGWHVF